jgi:hypothetical protein
MAFSFWWIAAAVFLFWLIGAYNRLVRLRAAIAQSFVGVQSALQQWVDLALPASLRGEAMPDVVIGPSEPVDGNVSSEPAEPSARAEAMTASSLPAGTPGNSAQSQASATAATLTDASTDPSLRTPDTRDGAVDVPISSKGLDAWAGLGASAKQLQMSAQALGLRPRNRMAASALVAAMQAVRGAWSRVGLAERTTLAPEEAALAALWMQQDTHVRLACAQFNESVLRYNAALRQFPAMVLAWLLRFKPAGTLE